MPTHRHRCAHDPTVTGQPHPVHPLQMGFFKPNPKSAISSISSPCPATATTLPPVTTVTGRPRSVAPTTNDFHVVSLFFELLSRDRGIGYTAGTCAGAYGGTDWTGGGSGAYTLYCKVLCRRKILAPRGVPPDALDPVIHERVRLGILTLLLQSQELDFVTIKHALRVTDGNLARHLRVLENAGLIRVRKTFVRRRPRTYYRLTPEGRRRFVQYLTLLREILASLPTEEPPP